MFPTLLLLVDLSSLGWIFTTHTGRGLVYFIGKYLVAAFTRVGSSQLSTSTIDILKASNI